MGATGAWRLGAMVLTGALLSWAGVTEGQVIESPSGNLYGHFGIGASTIGDVNSDSIPDLLIAAPGDFDNAGRLYLYSGSDRTLIRTFQSPNEISSPGEFALGSRFSWHHSSIHNVGGTSLNDIAVVALGEVVSSMLGAGRLYIFDPSNSTPLYTVESPNPEAFGSFGNAASIPDANGDTVRDLLVGASGELSGAGRAYIMSGANPNVLLQTLSAPNGGAFGGTVMNLGDLNSDTIDEFAITAVAESHSSVSAAGRVYVFDGATRAPMFTLQKPTPLANDYFGQSVAQISSVNGDGIPDIAISSEKSENGAPRGSVNIFSGADGSHIADLDPTQTHSYAYMGYFVTNTPDINGDGKEDIAVSNAMDFSNSFETGEVLIFSGDDLSYLAVITSPIPENGAMFGIVHRSGDLDGDGIDELIVGALRANGNKGRVFVITLSGDLDNTPQSLNFRTRPPNTGPSKQFAVNVENQGLLPLTITTSSFLGADAGDFHFVSDPAGTIIPPQATVPIYVVYEPSDLGASNASVEIHTNDTTNGTLVVGLTGFGFNYPNGGPGEVVYGMAGSAVLVFDVLNDEWSVLSDQTVGLGPDMNSVSAIAVEDSDSLLVALGYSVHKVLRIDRVTGDRTVVATGGSISLAPSAMEIDGTGGVFVVSTTTGSVHRFDLATGVPTIVSDGVTGTGPLPYTPMDILVDNGVIVISDVYQKAILHIDPVTGNRDILVGGFSSSYIYPGFLDVLDSTHYVTLIAYFTPHDMYKVNRATGAATLLSANTLAQGPLFGGTGAGVVTSAGAIYAAGLDALLQVDSVTGARTLVVSGASVVPGSNSLSSYLNSNIKFAVELESSILSRANNWTTYE